MAEGLYIPDSLPNFIPSRDLGDPGSVPFTRGIHSTMYRGKEFVMRQLTGYGLPTNTNDLIKFMLSNGASGISVLFDFPTIQLSDSDSPLSRGQVGTSGVCVDTIDDMYLIFKDIDLEKHSISLVTHYPSNTAVLFSMFLAMAEEKGFNISNLRGSVQNDVTMENIVSGINFITPKNCFRVQCDNIEYIRNKIPKWTPITLNGYNLRDAGASDVTEMAVAISNGLATISELHSRGYDPSFISSRITFFWDIGSNFFNEVSRLRAVRKLWCNLLFERFSITDPSALKLKCHVQTSGISLTRQEPYNNIIRSSFQALAAILGGVQSLHVDSYDEAYSIPTEESALLSLRTQQIIQTETGITDIIDPLGGSYYVEYKTLEYERLIRKEVENIDKLGGYIKLVESKKINKELDKNNYEYQRAVDSGEIKIVALNKYCSSKPPQPISSFTYVKEVEDYQISELARRKSKRDKSKVNDSLRKLKEVCKTSLNIFPSCIECAKSRCTKEEMFNVFKESFGG